MTSERVELIRKLTPPAELDLAAWFRDAAGFTAVTRSVQPLFSPEFDCVIHLPPHEPRRYSGLDGLREAWLDWLQPWASYRNEIGQLFEAPDGRVVMLGQVWARFDPQGAEVAHAGAALWTVREGKVTRVEFFADRAEALREAGLSADQLESLPPASSNRQPEK